MSIFSGVGNRGGTRGGKDQFSWDDVRGDKFKEYYLGQSLKVRQGSQIGVSTQGWWLDGKLKGDKSNPHSEEIERVKQQEQELMMEEL